MEHYIYFEECINTLVQCKFLSLSLIFGMGVTFLTSLLGYVLFRTFSMFYPE